MDKTEVILELLEGLTKENPVKFIAVGGKAYQVTYYPSQDFTPEQKYRELDEEFDKLRTPLELSASSVWEDYIKRYHDGIKRFIHRKLDGYEQAADRLLESMLFDEKQQRLAISSGSMTSREVRERNQTIEEARRRIKGIWR